MLPADFHLTSIARLGGSMLLGGEPFAVVHCGESTAEQVCAWATGAPVGAAGALARALVQTNLAQPTPPSLSRLPPVTVVIAVRDRSIARLLAALDVAEVIVVDDASADGASLRAEASRFGARYLRREVRGGAAAARNMGLAAASHELVACVDSDCVPLTGWLEALLPHFADPELSAIAPRIVPLRNETQLVPTERVKLGSRCAALREYEARHSPLDRGPAPARVIPYGRVPFVPGAAIVVRRHLRFDEAFTSGGEDVEFVWRVPYVRYEPNAQVGHDHRTHPGAWFKRRVYYGRTAAAIAKRHPGKARPLHVSPWTTAAWLALAARRPKRAVGILALATALTARKGVPITTAAALAAGGSLRSGRVVADALTRHWWPISAAAALAVPTARIPLAAALATKSPLQLIDDLAYGIGLWQGCLENRTLDPLLPARAWKLEHRRQ